MRILWAFICSMSISFTASATTEMKKSFQCDASLIASLKQINSFEKASESQKSALRLVQIQYYVRTTTLMETYDVIKNHLQELDTKFVSKDSKSMADAIKMANQAGYISGVSSAHSKVANFVLSDIESLRPCRNELERIFKTK